MDEGKFVNSAEAGAGSSKKEVKSHAEMREVYDKAIQELLNLTQEVDQVFTMTDEQSAKKIVKDQYEIRLREASDKSQEAFRDWLESVISKDEE